MHASDWAVVAESLRGKLRNNMSPEQARSLWLGRPSDLRLADYLAREGKLCLLVVSTGQTHAFSPEIRNLVSEKLGEVR